MTATRKEWLTAGLCLAVLLFFLRKALFLGTAVFPHDNLYWNYPIFRFFAHSLLNGEIPWWNPFSHGGEPFYPLWGQMRLYDPITLLLFGVVSRFTDDLLLLFHWVRFGQILFCLAGIYFFLRSECQSIFVRLSLLVILCFSSTFLCSLRQDGIIHSFLWAPWATLFLRNFLRDGEWKYGVACAVAVGVNFQTYFFAGIWIWFLFLGTGILLFKREEIFNVIPFVSERKKVVGLLALLALFALPNMALVADSRDFLLPARTAPQGYEKLPDNGAPYPAEPRPWDYVAPLRMPYAFVKATGGHSAGVDFLQLLSPEGNPSIFNPKWAWGTPSDAYTYLGILPFLIALFGIVAGKGEWKRVMLWSTAGMGLLMAGPLAGVHRILFAVYPPVWFIRNTSCLVLFFQFGLLYFFVLGANAFWSRTLVEIGKKKLGVFFGATAAYLVTVFEVSTEKLSWGIPLVIVLGAFFYFRFRKTAFLILLLADLLLRFHRADTLYAEQKPLEEIFKLPTKNVGFQVLQKRNIAPSYPLGVYHQVPRYLELVELKPYAFSSPFITTEIPWKPKTTVFESVWRNYRWNSYLLLRHYYQTIYFDKSPQLLSQAFRIAESPLAFRRTILGPMWPVTYRLLSPGYSSFKVSVDVPGPGWIYFADGYHKYWTANVDGNLVKPVLADGAFKAVPVDGVRHDITFKYRPWPFMLSLLMYYAAFLSGTAMCVVFAFLDNRGRQFRRENSDSESPGGIVPPEAAPVA